MSVIVSGPVAFLTRSSSGVYFSSSSPKAGSFETKAKSTYTPIRKLQNAIDVAYWGEDNRFPQNIANHLSYCSIAPSLLDIKARSIWGGGLIAGKVVDYEDGGSKEVFQPLQGSKYKPVFDFINDRRFFRFWLEFLQDWTHFSNCFPEFVFSYDAKVITGIVHQESCDARFKQMSDTGSLDKVYLSKIWGATKDQFVRFDPKKNIPGLVGETSSIPTSVDGVWVKEIDAIDMYDPLNSAIEISEKLRAKGLKAAKTAILPVNYPSVNKTYYQVPYWDGARLSGWIEIASKIPSIYKSLYKKAFNLKYHIEIPESYFPEKYGIEKWASMKESEKTEAKSLLLREMDEFLSSDENAHKTFISFFSTDHVTKKDFGNIKINAIKSENNIDENLIVTSAANVEIAMAMQVHPSRISAGMPGSTHRSGGGSGSDIREGALVHQSALNLERQVILEPLYLVRDFNRIVGGMDEWEEDIVFRFRDTILTTLDTGRGTQKIVS